jgi:ADP-heptose:LPS heptosyltransferase
MEAKPLLVLIRLLGGVGLGDAVQHTILLKHLRRYRPAWRITVRAAKGIESCLHGLCDRVITEESQEDFHDQAFDIHLHEQYLKFTDRPSTKVAFVLHEVFGIEPYDMDLGRYECPVSESQKHRAVLIHYQGGSSTNKKNLHDWQASELCDLVRRAGRVPVVLDLQRRSTLVDNKTIFSPHVGPNDMWGGFGNADAALLAGLISVCEAFVGIDSGPGKLASATATPSLICWTKHHPLQFHDPAPNTTHLIPKDWEGMSPLEGDPDMVRFFERHYTYCEYASGDHGLVAGVIFWLTGALGAGVDTGITFVVPPDKKSAVWALCKMRIVSAGRPIDVVVAGDERNADDRAAVDFLRRFDYLRSVRLEDVAIYAGPDRPRNTRGHLLYVEEGVRGGRHYLTPGAVFETGRTLEDWMPSVSVDEEVLAELPEHLRDLVCQTQASPAT